MKEHNTGVVNLSSTTYCSAYKGGTVSYIVRNGICYVSLNSVTFTDQTSSKVDRAFNGFPKVKNNFVSYASMAGGNLVGEVYAYAGWTHLICRSLNTTAMYGSMAYVVDYD